MANQSPTKTPRTIERICHDWRVSLARLELECTEAEDDEPANRNAINGEAQRANSLLKDMEAAEISSCSDAEDLLYIVLKLMKDGAHDHDQVMSVLRKVAKGLAALDRKERTANQAKEAA